MARRIGNSIWGIPNYLITGIAIFLIASVLYDLAVGDRNTARYVLLISSIVVLISSIVLHFAPLKTINRQFRRQMGA